MHGYDKARASPDTVRWYSLPTFRARKDPASEEKTYSDIQKGANDYDPYEESPVAGQNQSPAASGILLNDGQATGHNGQVLQNTQKTTTWKIHWRTPALILGLLALGIALALGHHFYYWSLNGTVVSSQTRQEWALRFGTAFASLTQSALVASAGVAYTQRLWSTVKKRAFHLKTLDNVFSLQTTIWSFFSWEVLSKAKILYLLGICIWCIPIASLVTPATLSVRASTSTSNQTVNVPYPDYTTDAIDKWVSLDGAVHLDAPSPELTLVYAASLTSMAVVPLTAPFPNSSYTLDFYGPSLQCQNLSDAVINNTLDTGDAATLQEAWDQTMEEQFPENQFGVLYIGVSPGIFISGHLFFNLNGADAGGTNYSCHFWNMSYTVNFVFRDGVQSTEILKAEPLSPLDLSDNNKPFEDYAPGEMQALVMSKLLKRTLVANIRWGSTGSLMGGDSNILNSAIAACPEIKEGTADSGLQSEMWFNSSLCRAGSVPGAIEDLSQNLTLSVLSSAQLSNETAARVTVHTSATVYSYNWRNLLLAYAIAAAAAAACAAVGLQALVENGYSASTTFSSILLTTRNADLDDLARGHCLGEFPLAKDVGDTRLRYGILRSQDDDVDVSESHACFGFAGDVRELKKREPCW